jgi:hypothetical protein
MMSASVADLHSVHGSRSDDVWFAGDVGTLLHWDGRTLAQASSGVTTHLHAVFSARATDAWAAGDGVTILHWDGAAWQRAEIRSTYPPSPTISFHRLRGSGPSDLYALMKDIGPKAHWDGAAWTFDYDEVGVDVDIAPGGADFFWRLRDGAILAQDQGAILAQDQGPSVTLASAGTMRAIWASRAAGVWAVGRGGAIIHRAP